MKSYKQHLQNMGYSSTTIESYLNTFKRFEKWIYKEAIELDSINYGDIINYIKSLQNRQLSQKSIQFYVKAIHRYYAFRIDDKKYKKANPAEKIKIQGLERKRTLNFLTYQELIEIYANYKGEGIVYDRNICILGLIIFQGLATRDLLNLIVENVDLKNGIVHIPERKRANKRSIRISKEQVFRLNHYINISRKFILTRKGIESTFLLISNGSGNYLQNSLQNLMKTIKRKNPRIKNINHLRASVICDWTKKYNLRKVQYLAGHRFVSSTESYLINDMDEFKNEIISFHPNNPSRV
jgi:site-specific recombinase XerD